jgi:probable rRNA maturation factor
VNLRQLRSLARDLLDQQLAVINYDLAVHLIAAPEMTRLNETCLRHGGSTDVITFNYLEARGSNDDFTAPWGEVAIRSGGPEQSGCSPPSVYGEIIICVDEAIIQARRFRTSWQSEVLRYLIHGILHLRGYDDVRVADRSRMKREETRLLRCLTRQFSLRNLARNSES